MLTSIGKFSKSFFVKLLVGIIILPFVFWGMGDVFRGGNQNVIASIDSEKVSTQEFIEYLNRLNLNKEQLKNLPKTDLVEKILSDYIGKKVMALEIKKLGISVNDNSLRDIIKNGGFVRCGWDGKQETELKIKEDTKATIRCIPFNENPNNLTCIFSGNKAMHEVIFSKSY